LIDGFVVTRLDRHGAVTQAKPRGEAGKTPRFAR
jgi:hypothetical protein